MFNSLFDLNVYIFAQNVFGNEFAQAIIEDSIDLAANTARSWQRIWDITVSPQEALWQAMVALGLFLAAISIIYFALKESDRLINNPSWRRLITMFRVPLGIFVFLSGNGFLLAGTIRTIRAIAYYWFQKVLEMTFAGISLNEALQRIQNTGVANARAREIFADCIDKTGLALEECLNDPQKQQQAAQILQGLQENSPLDGNLLQQVTDFSSQVVTTLVATTFLAPVQTFLIALQWAFINGIEVALFLTAMFSPVALGLSMIPAAAPSIIACASGFIALFFLQLGYILIVGVSANIIALTEQGGQTIGVIIPDIAFLILLSIIAPLMAGAIAKGGGTALFYGISRSATIATRLAVAGASGGSSLVATTAMSNANRVIANK
ncbi:hypothetical protein [Myxosarcina sp. GI1]|uniref:hypothetical protein n=1 Tax=Myxosarcina sp. GI1 TaxID=1541065 RepID=UPI00056ABB19|nr:hypothetical protein [Myxosarcina sp. GI1]